MGVTRVLRTLFERFVAKSVSLRLCTLVLRCYVTRVSPTVFRYQQYRFFFFSREEARIHVHVTCPDGEAKFWLEPAVELALNKGLRDGEVRELIHIIQERHNEIREHWHRHFGH